MNSLAYYLFLNHLYLPLALISFVNPHYIFGTKIELSTSIENILTKNQERKMKLDSNSKLSRTVFITAAMILINSSGHANVSVEKPKTPAESNLLCEVALATEQTQAKPAASAQSLFDMLAELDDKPVVQEPPPAPVEIQSTTVESQKQVADPTASENQKTPELEVSKKFTDEYYKDVELPKRQAFMPDDQERYDNYYKIAQEMVKLIGESYESKDKDEFAATVGPVLERVRSGRVKESNELLLGNFMKTRLSDLHKSKDLLKTTDKYIGTFDDLVVEFAKASDLFKPELGNWDLLKTYSLFNKGKQEKQREELINNLIKEATQKAVPVETAIKAVLSRMETDKLEMIDLMGQMGRQINTLEKVNVAFDEKIEFLLALDNAIIDYVKNTDRTNEDKKDRLRHFLLVNVLSDIRMTITELKVNKSYCQEILLASYTTYNNFIFQYKRTGFAIDRMTLALPASLMLKVANAALKRIADSTNKADQVAANLLKEVSTETADIGARQRQDYDTMRTQYLNIILEAHNILDAENAAAEIFKRKLLESELVAVAKLNETQEATQVALGDIRKATQANKATIDTQNVVTADNLQHLQNLADTVSNIDGKIREAQATHDQLNSTQERLKQMSGAVWNQMTSAIEKNGK